MSTYLYRLAHLAFQRRRLVRAIWLVAGIAANAIAWQAAEGPNDTSTIPAAGPARRC
jgi:hypothetical protein